MFGKGKNGFELTHPVPDIKKALLICEIKEQQKAHGIPEERCGQTAKSAGEFRRDDANHTTEK